MSQNINNFINQIPTKFRGKYIRAFKTLKNKDSNKVLLKELEDLALQTQSKKLPKITYPNLPVSEKVDEIKKLIDDNQVIVVAGETGSGKSTQLPKICLDLGLGKRGLIGHTQPRRLAARSIASRVATEIQDSSKVSYKIRFSDQTSDNTLIKVMTDGVLLSEIKNDKYLSKYEVIIIDEAHERSLNIDFLLGCIKKILPFRPDLKVIITSATIDHQKFIHYFKNAEDIKISGRTYPVDIRYQNDEDFADFSLQERILYAIEELGRGDILIFLPTERDIHETLVYLNKQQLRFTEVLPLFSRLSNKEQNKIFNPDSSMRRIILATNVAETSLTVPRIKYVIDSGLARVSRYSYRTKIQRLPIEKISQASANQRAGRCGRLSAGVCIRLYSEEDFLSRKEFTDPEILRTNLASVILQMLFLRLGNIQDFSFIDEPDSRFVKDGYKLLYELQAISQPNYSKPKITADGLKMAVMPLDPKLAKMVLESQRQNCLQEIIYIVSFLSIRDPRERPLNFQKNADEKHAVDKDKNSDFITIINLANRLKIELKDLSNKQKRHYFRKNFISPVRYNEWNDIYRQIVENINQFGWKLNLNSENDSKQIDLALKYENIHKALITGLLNNIGYNREDAEYLGARGLKFFIFPGSSQFKKKPKWLLNSEVVETTKLYARNVAKIEPQWIESLAKHLVKKHYDEPIWSKKRKSVVVNERVVLYGLEIVSKRTIQYARINIEHAREIFIREALVNGDFDSKVYFFNENLKLIQQIEELENKSRRRDVLVDESVLFEHYDSVISPDVYDGASFEKWAKKLSKDKQKNFVFNTSELMQHDANEISQEKYPDTFNFDNMYFPLDYHFDPLIENDGANLILPVAFINNINPVVLEWGVYGFLYDKIVALLRALPKNIRKHCVPVPAYSQAIFESIDFEKDRYKPLKSVIANHITRMVGFVVKESDWKNENLDKHLILSIKVIDENNKTLAVEKDIYSLREKFQNFAIKEQKKVQEKIYYDWDFEDFDKTKKIKQYGVDLEVYNCIEEFQDGVKLAYKTTQNEAITTTQKALLKLIKIRLNKNLIKTSKKTDLQSLSMSIKLDNSSDRILEKAIEVSFLGSDNLPYKRADFEDLYKQGLKVFEQNRNSIKSIVADIFEYKNTLDKKLSLKKIPLNLVEIYSDVRKELNKLFDDDYLSVPLAYLQRYKYYIQAQENRLEKAKTNLQRDRAYKIEVQELEAKLLKEISNKYLNTDSESVVKASFLIKELWVSWYLQNVKTIESVSYKRITSYLLTI